MVVNANARLLIKPVAFRSIALRLALTEMDQARTGSAPILPWQYTSGPAFC